MIGLARNHIPIIEMTNKYDFESLEDVLYALETFNLTFGAKVLLSYSNI